LKLPLDLEGTNNKSGTGNLCQKAEELLKENPSATTSPLQEGETRKLLYELDIRMILSTKILNLLNTKTAFHETSDLILSYVQDSLGLMTIFLKPKIC